MAQSQSACLAHVSFTVKPQVHMKEKMEASVQSHTVKMGVELKWELRRVRSDLYTQLQDVPGFQEPIGAFQAPGPHLPGRVCWVRK